MATEKEFKSESMAAATYVGSRTLISLTVDLSQVPRRLKPDMTLSVIWHPRGLDRVRQTFSLYWKGRATALKKGSRDAKKIDKVCLTPTITPQFTV
jgi:hypothetical protein